MSSDRQQAPIAGESTGNLRVLDLAGIQGWGWDACRFAEEVSAFRARTIEGLPSQAMGESQVLGPVYFEHPDTWRILVDAQSQILGVWHFLSLSEDAMRIAMEGGLNVRDIHSGILTPLDHPGHYDIYVLTYAVAPVWRLSAASMAFARSMFDVYHALAVRGIFVRRLGANFVSKEGIGIARALDLGFVCEHQVLGDVYGADFPSLLERLQYTDRRGAFVRQLKELYAHADAAPHPLE